jgi:hypothetical protein
MSTWLGRCYLAFFLCLAVSPAFAQLAQYGYVVGTLEPEKSFLEKLDEPNKGKYLHYHIFLKTASSEEYEVVIDVNDVSPTKPLIYRLASLDNQTATELATDFGPVFSATSDFHLISNTQSSYGPLLTPDDAGKQAAGALDYIRHPGLLKATRNLPWQNMYAQTTSDPLQWSLPALDAQFKASTSPFRLPSYTKVYVFGGPFTYGGKGMHVVHQNQGDTGSTYSATNATWQDGAVIIERHTYLLGWRVSRSVLMTKFANQTDFTAEVNDVAHPALPGHVVNPTVETFPMGMICGDWLNYGPFYATQLEVSTNTPDAEPYGPGSAPKIEVHVKNGAFTSYDDMGDYTIVDNATDASAAGRAFGRAYSPMWIFFWPGHPAFDIRSAYYVRVHAIDPGSYCDSGVGANLRVSHY